MSLSRFVDNPERLVTAFVLAAIVSLLAAGAHALTRNGAIAATAVGTLIVAGSGWWCGAALVIYFVTSTALSKLQASRTTEVRQRRGSSRDAVQVIANGGIPAILSLIGWVTGSSVWTISALCAIAVATADTWATEVGRLTRAVPRSITQWRKVESGTSGAVSVPGTSASVIGSLLMGSLTAVGIANDWVESNQGTFDILIVVFLAGIAGSLLDSLLGATIQESFYCESCSVATESSVHDCGSDCRRTSGIAGINNDVVNFLSIAIPSLAAVIFVGLLA